ncbi:MAG: mannitol dehydrogenase family protein [Clostridiales bacterium]|nr:mannitol dehydrogenase family protein [Clostridiales bacterium]
MRLNKNIYNDREVWESKGYHIPEFDRRAVAERTSRQPRWLHFGAGNIFRAFLARAMSGLLEQGKTDTGIIVAEGYDRDIIEDIYIPHDLLSISVNVDSRGNMEKSIVNSVTEALYADPGSDRRLKEIFENPSLSIVSFTITEKGYEACDPMDETSFLGLLVRLLLARYQSGGFPLALVSMDNCSRNGWRLWQAVHSIAGAWEACGRAPEGFVRYIDNPERISFPWTMIDKITPRPSDVVQKALEKDGIEGIINIETKKHTYIASFVNAEAFECLVIEDAFPNGRPPFEAAGFLMADRMHVELAEKMKVCACLNPLHTALAVFGCLLGKETIAEAMEDVALYQLAYRLGFDEGLPVVSDPEILSPRRFLECVLKERLRNPFIPDTPARIATDTSHKIPIRFGQTVTAWQQAKNRDQPGLKMIPLVLAGWCRYLMGTDDSGNRIELSKDSRLQTLCPVMEAMAGQAKGLPYEERQQIIADFMAPLFDDQFLWGCDLRRGGLDQVVVQNLNSMMSGPGSVYKTLWGIVFGE